MNVCVRVSVCVCASIIEALQAAKSRLGIAERTNISQKGLKQLNSLIDSDRVGQLFG